MKRHREQTLPRTTTPRPLRKVLFTLQDIICYFYIPSRLRQHQKEGGKKTKKKTPENRRAAVSPVVRLRSRVRFLRRNICRIYFLGFPLSPVTEGSGDTSVRVCRWSSAPPPQSGTMKTLRAGGGKYKGSVEIGFYNRWFLIFLKKKGKMNFLID